MGIGASKVGLVAEAHHARARLAVRGAQIDVRFPSEEDRRKFFDAIDRADGKMREVAQLEDDGRAGPVWIRPSSVDLYRVDP